MKKSQLALAVTAAFGAGVAHAVAVPVALTGASSESSNGGSVSNVTGSTASWSYETSTGVVTATGFYQAATQIAPVLPGQLFTHNISNIAVGGGNAATATSYSCAEGSFGGIVGASLCGNYSFGGNAVNDSTVSYGPGIAFSKTMGGDDITFGPQQNLANYDGMTGGPINNFQLVISNAIPGVSGQEITFDAAPGSFKGVPVPAAVWLFGSALGLLGWVRRKMV